MRLTLLLLCLTGCATTSSGPAAPPEPEGKLCVSSDVCGGLTCAKALDAQEGVCSSLVSAPACTTSKQCPTGAYCHRPPGFNGVCFKP